MKLFNTLTRTVEAIVPLSDKQITLYTCGLTVYSHPHIGNWAYFIFCDILHRTLLNQDFTVNRVQNITDVGHLTDDADDGEDKMQKGARLEGKTAWQVAEKYIALADREGFESLGLLRPKHMPRATAYIPQQIAFVEGLEKKGYTYRLADGIYFDTSTLDDYGKLARLDIKGLKQGHRVASEGKKNPTDFALWKFSPPGSKRDMEWESPWGVGFPGWHLECSAMARELLGDSIDIHTGGIDHIPVHHTNEIAQSEALSGKKFATYWAHANHIKVNGTKMSKSLGNLFTLDDIEKKGYSLQAFKLLVISKHYRTEGNFTWDIMEAAQNRLKRWLQVADLRWQLAPIANNHATELTRTLKATLATAQTALADDLDTPKVVAHIDTIMNTVEKYGLSKETLPHFTAVLEFVRETLGIDLFNEDVASDAKKLLTKRIKARNDKDWLASDELRTALESMGIGVKDSADGQTWFRL